MVIAPGGRVIFKQQGEVDVLELRRVILANLENKTYVGHPRLLGEEVVLDGPNMTRRALWRALPRRAQLGKAAGAPVRLGVDLFSIRSQSWSPIEYLDY